MCYSWIGLMFGGLLADRLLNRHHWPLLKVRRLLSGVGLFAPAFWMMLVTRMYRCHIYVPFISSPSVSHRWYDK
jgi:hypothetical protein